MLLDNASRLIPSVPTQMYGSLFSFLAANMDCHHSLVDTNPDIKDEIFKFQFFTAQSKKSTFMLKQAKVFKSKIRNSF